MQHKHTSVLQECELFLRLSTSWKQDVFLEWSLEVTARFNRIFWESIFQRTTTTGNPEIGVSLPGLESPWSHQGCNFSAQSKSNRKAWFSDPKTLPWFKHFLLFSLKSLGKFLSCLLKSSHLWHWVLINSGLEAHRILHMSGEWHRADFLHLTTSVLLIPSTSSVQTSEYSSLHKATLN